MPGPSVVAVQQLSNSGPILWPSEASLQMMCQAFTHLEGVDDAMTKVHEWAGWIVGPDVGVVLSVPDAGGRLRTTSIRGRAANHGRKRSTRRRDAFDSGRTILLKPPGGERASLLVPLRQGERTIGVLQIDGDPGALEMRQASLQAMAVGAVTALELARTNDRRTREVGSLWSSLGILRGMLDAETAEAVVRVALDYVFRRFRVPAAGWLVGQSDGEHRLVAHRGIWGERRVALKNTMGSLRRGHSSSRRAREALEIRFGMITGMSPSTAVAGESVILLVGDGSPDVRSAAVILASLLDVVIGHRTTVATASRRNEQLDLGLAWTAHEFRSPLLASSLVIDRLLAAGDLTAFERDLLTRAGRGLDLLASEVDGLLRWATGTQTLEQSAADLVVATREAIESAALPDEERRVFFDTPESIPITVNASYIRSAIANLIRNALDYSTPGTTVVVRLRANGDGAMVEVRNVGVPLSESERRTIFDPFVRGPHGAAQPRGRGLGLFVTQRIVEAHGGTVSVGSNRGQTTFRIELPTKQVSK